jgi:hypothetical protein
MVSPLSDYSSYSNCLDKYSNLLRKISFIHPKVIGFFCDEIQTLVNSLDHALLDWEKTEEKKSKLLEIRRLTFQLEHIVNVRVIEKYNQLLDEVLETKKRNVSVTSSKPAAYAVEHSSIVPKISVQPEKTPEKAWESISEHLRTQLKPYTYNVWVKPVRYLNCAENTIKVQVQNVYYKNWLDEHCGSLIKEHLEDLEADYNVEFVTAS